MSFLHEIPRESLTLGLSERQIKAIRAYKRDFKDSRVGVWLQGSQVVDIGYYGDRADSPWNSPEATYVWHKWEEEHIDNWNQIFEIYESRVPEFSMEWITIHHV